MTRYIFPSCYSCLWVLPLLHLSVSLILLFLAHPRMHAESFDLFHYQHRARCTLGASCLAFISTGYRDVSMVGVCICPTWCKIFIYFFFLDMYDWAGADCECMNVDMCTFLSWQPYEWAQGSDPKRLPGDPGGAFTSKDCKGLLFQHARQGGEILFMCSGAALAEPAAKTRAWHLHIPRPAMQV